MTRRTTPALVLTLTLLVAACDSGTADTTVSTTVPATSTLATSTSSTTTMTLPPHITIYYEPGPDWELIEKKAMCSALIAGPPPDLAGNPQSPGEGRPELRTQRR